MNGNKLVWGMFTLIFGLTVGAYGYAYKVDGASENRLKQAVEDRNQRIKDHATTDDYRWTDLNTRYERCMTDIQDLRERMKVAEWRLNNPGK